MFDLALERHGRWINKPHSENAQEELVEQIQKMLLYWKPAQSVDFLSLNQTVSFELYFIVIFSFYSLANMEYTSVVPYFQILNILG